MRSFFSAVLVVVGLVLAALAMPLIWAERNIVQTEGFVAKAAPLGKDPQVQQAFTADILDRFGAQLLPGGSDSSGSQILRNLVESTVGQMVGDFSNDPGFAEAFNESLRVSQTQALKDPETTTGDTGELTADLGPLVKFANQKIQDTGGAFASVKLPESYQVTVGGPEKRNALLTLQDATEQRLVLAGASAVALLLGLLCARRRSTTVAFIGLGTLILAAVWYLGASALASQLPSSTISSQFSTAASQALVKIYSNDFNSWILWAVWIGLALVVLGVIARIIGGRQGKQGQYNDPEYGEAPTEQYPARYT